DVVSMFNLESLKAPAAANARGREAGDFWQTLQNGSYVWVPPALAEAKSVRLVIGGQLVDLPVAGPIQAARDGAEPPNNLLVMDLPRLQRLIGRVGRIDRVEFIVAPGPRVEERRAELGAFLRRLGGDGSRWFVRTPGARREVAKRMTEAFRLNLLVLSLIALLVGLYLILQALDGAVVRRRQEIAILRSLGVDASTIRGLWLVESAALGMLGGLAGVGLGWLGAQGAVRAVGRTVNTLYYATTVSRAGLDWPDAWLGLGLGIAASIAAGWWPAKEAAQTPPAQILGRGAAPGAAFWRRPWIGVALLAAGYGLIWFGPLRLAGGVRFPLAGYAAALAWILGGGIVFAGTLPLAAGLCRGLGWSGAAARVALTHLRRPSGRHGLAVASLLCAVGMSAGMAILVSSFERTVRHWIAHSLAADLYLYSAGARSASASSQIPAAIWRRIVAHPGVADALVLAAYPIQIGKGAPALLTGTDLRRMHRLADLPWIEGPDRAAFDPARNAHLVVVSESFSDRFRKWKGDRLTLPTPAGPEAVTVAGVYADYGNERGTVMAPWHSLVSWMGDDSATHVSLFLRPEANAVAMRAELTREFPGLEVFTQRELRELVLRVFRQTFSITYALEVIGIFVAVAGLALAMASVLLDRRDELTTLRALGFSRREIAGAASSEGLALAVWAIIGGLTLSLAMGWLLIHVINKQSFGWTLQFHFPSGQIAILGVAVATTGWAVSYAVGLWGAELPADREE
ncbi:MAG: FtsX-like permease family protein, partial [Opitutaceae bacterium]